MSGDQLPEIKMISQLLEAHKTNKLLSNRVELNIEAFEHPQVKTKIDYYRSIEDNVTTGNNTDFYNKLKPDFSIQHSEGHLLTLSNKISQLIQNNRFLEYKYITLNVLMSNISLILSKSFIDFMVKVNALVKKKVNPSDGDGTVYELLTELKKKGIIIANENIDDISTVIEDWISKRDINFKNEFQSKYSSLENEYKAIFTQVTDTLNKEE